MLIIFPWLSELCVHCSEKCRILAEESIGDSLTRRFAYLLFYKQRGMGEGAVGCSLSLVASGEDKFHAKIVKALNVSFAEVPMDGRLLSSAQERVNLACKVASTEDSERKTQRDNQWFKDQAAEAGLEVDEDMLDDGLAGGDSRDKARLNEARLARDHLAAQNGDAVRRWQKLYV